MPQLTAPRTESRWKLTQASDEATCDVITCVLNATISKLPPRHEKRRHKRHAFPYLVSLTPIAETELTQLSDPIVVVGKHLSAGGFDFFHPDPLPYKRVIASFHELPWGSTHVVLVSTWCRFLRPGWYDSGGRFTHIVEEANG
jgi:hypothetical protein